MPKTTAESMELRTRSCRAVLVALLSLLPGLGHTADADASDPPRWIVGRTAEVFRPAEQVLTTRIGGWLDGSYEDNNADGSRRSIRLNHLNGFADTRYGDAWQLFLEFEYEDETDLSGYEDEQELETEQAWLRWSPDPRFGIRAGKFNTPFGIWTPLHWSILMDTIQKPIHEGTRVVPEQPIGGELSGRFFPEALFDARAEVSYSLYAGWGDNTAVFEETESDGLSFGGDLRVLLDDAHLAGVSYYQQDNAKLGHRTERNVMLYGQLELPCNLTFRSEYLHQWRDRRPGRPSTLNITYLKLRWNFRPDFYLNYRANFGDFEAGGEVVDANIHTFTLGYRPATPVRVKLEYSSNRYSGDREDFGYWGVSVGYLF